MVGKKPQIPDRQISSNAVIQYQKQVEYKARDKREKQSRKGKDGKKKKPEKEDKSNYDTDIHIKDTAQILSEFETSLENGLSTDQVNKLRTQYGYNELTPPPSLPWYIKLLLSIFGGFFNQLLWVGSILCFVAYIVAAPEEKDISYLYLGIVLAVVVTLTGVFGYYQEAKSDDIMEGFKNLAPEDVEVVRDGKLSKIEPRLLVPGDIVGIELGMKLPADVRVLECSKDMEVDNASLTGEAEPQARKKVKEDDKTMLPIESRNIAFFGTNILKGKGRALVFKTGDNTLMGSIAAMAADTGAVETPIAREIHDFVKKISAIAFALGISFFIVSYVKSGDPIVAVVLLIGIIVANVPEGLLATVTVSLTLTARRMAIKKVRVKNLESVETLGSTSVICSDKTGTLTTSIMTCESVVFDTERVRVDTSDPEHATNGAFYGPDKMQLPSFKRLLRCGVLCNNSKKVVNEKTGKHSFTSDPTEQAIFKFCLGNIDQIFGGGNDTKVESLRSDHYPKLAEIPFNSKNKWQVSVHNVASPKACFSGETQGDSIIEIKGAPERILTMCSTYCYEGEDIEMTPEVMDRIRALNTEMAEDGERVLGFADMQLDGAAYPQAIKEPVFNPEAMTVDGVAIPEDDGGSGVTVLYEGKKIPVDWKRCTNRDGEPYDALSKIPQRYFMQYLETLVNIPPAQMRLFHKKACKENGLLDDDTLSFGDLGISEGATLLLVVGKYKFAGTSALDANWPMKGFRFLGFYAMIDPPRSSVPDAVRKCQAAGIKVVMVTGDHPTTAKAIAKQVNIIPDRPDMKIGLWTKAGQDPIIPEGDYDAVVVAGGKLKEELEIGASDPDYEERFWNTVLSQRKYCVFARTSPRQKLLIVQACQNRGGIVAVTGDGVNDSPALKKADIGVAMGITGTEVAKDAADMILLDDNFASIVKGVEEGRIIFDNLKKSIAYTLSSNIPEIAPFLFNQTVGLPLPLTTVMILLVDLGTDLAPAISLAHEGKEADIMQRPPRDPERDNLVTWRLISFSYLQIGILQAIAGFYAYFCVLFEWGIEPKHMFGMDSTVLFVPQKNKDKMKYGYFMWCFDDASKQCVYTPAQFDCNWIGWNGDDFDPFRKGNEWAMNNWADYSSQPEFNGWGGNPFENESACKDHKDAGAETFGQFMFASMVCQWAGGSESECTYQIDNGVVEVSEGALPAFDAGSVFAGYTGSLVYKSSGTEDGIVLHTSERYENRYCQEEDYLVVKEMDDSDKNWSDGPAGDTYHLSAVKAINEKRYTQGSDFFKQPLCNAQGEMITMGDGHAASIYPMQMNDRQIALSNSNTAYFISIIVVQWADLMICKTRSRSLFEQGMTNVFMNWSLFFETALGAFLCYVPLAHDVVGTRAIDFVWWTPAIPFSIAIYCYDELRKGVIRQYPKGWLQYNTYW